MRTTLLLLAVPVLAVLLASGGATAQTAEPEHPLYEFAGRWNLDDPSDNAERIAVDSRDFVYLATFSGIEKYTSDGTFVKKWSVECGANGVAADSENNVYVLGGCETTRDEVYVQKFTSGGTSLTKWGSRGAGDGQFHYPQGIAVDSKGFVYVADYSNRRIQKFTSDGSFVTKWSPHDRDYPTDVAVDSEDNVYLLDSLDGVQKFTSDGTFLKRWGGFYGYWRASGIGTDSQDNVYVTEELDDQVQKYTSDGAFVTAWGSDGQDDGQFEGLTDVAVDSRGHAYVTEFWGTRIQEFVVAPDTVAPVTRPGYLGPNQTIRTNSDYGVNLETTDQGVGAKELTYSATGAQPIEPTKVLGSSTAAPTAWVVISAVGSTTLFYSSVDRAGNVEETTKRTTVIIDKTPPRVSATSPRSRATGVAPGAKIHATFSEDMYPYKITWRSFKLFEQGNPTPLAATITYDEQARKATLVPKDPLKDGTVYKARVGILARDLAYNQLDQRPTVEGNQFKGWRFTVGSP